MALPRDLPIGRIRKVHPYAWLWEPLETDPGFMLRAFFGGKMAYFEGRPTLYFSAKKEPWRGVMACTDRERQPALVAEFPSLKPHPILPKWLYLPETADDFEKTAQRLIRLARARDPRLGVDPKPKRSRKTSVGRPR